MKIRIIHFWFLGALAIVATIWYFHGESTLFYGVAEATESSISVEEAVEVMALPLVVGQSVSKGDTLALLRRPELSMRISVLERELEGASGKSSLTSADLDRRAAEIRAELETRRHQLQWTINDLLEQRRRNQEITARLQSMPLSSASTDSTDALMLRVRALERELASAEAHAKSQISLLQGSQGVQRQSGFNERQAMQRELALLREEQAKLVVIAQHDAIVASIQSHVGDKVSPFSPLCTLSSHRPTLVRGYIHEKVYSSVALGDTVLVSSQSNRSGAVQGVVVGMGTRIVEFPLRMRKVATMPIWGREVTVRIPEQNHFLIGEYLSLRPKRVANLPLARGGNP